MWKSKQGKVHGNRGRKGQVSWNKGLTRKTDSRIKCSKGAFKKDNIPWNKGIKIDIEKYPSYGMTGKHHTQVTKDRCREGKKGCISPMKGK